MVESQDTIHYTTSHKETFRKLNDTLWNLFRRSFNISGDECDSMNVHEIDVVIMHCIFKGLNFYLLTIYHKLEIVQINAKNIFRNKLNDITSRIVMICNYINRNYRQQCKVFTNIVLLKRKNRIKEQHFIHYSIKNQKSQLKVKQLRSLKTILKFLSSQFNLNFEIGNSKSAIDDALSHANFFVSSSRRRDSSNSLCNQSVTLPQNVFKLLKIFKNSIMIHKYDKRMANSNKSVNNLMITVQSTIGTKNIKKDELKQEKHLNATEIEMIEPLFCNKQNVRDKIDLIKFQNLQMKNNKTTSANSAEISDINGKYNQRFKKRLLLSVRKKRKLNSKNQKKKYNEISFKSKARKAKRHIRSTHDLLFNGKKKTRSANSDPIPSNPALTRYIHEDIDLKSLFSSSAKNSVNSLLSDGNRERPGREIEEVSGEIADALSSEKIAEDERRLEDSREGAAAAFFAGRSRWPSRAAKNNRRSVSRSRRSPLKIAARPAGKIDGEAAEIITTSGDCEERLRRQQPIRKSVDSDKPVVNSQAKPRLQSDIVIGKRTDEITSGGAAPEKLILKLSIAKDLEAYIKDDKDALLFGSLFKDFSKLGKMPKSVRIEIIGPTKPKSGHEKREILSSNNYPRDFAANDKSFYDDGMKLEQELKELPKLHFKSRLNKLRNRQKFGKLRSNLREDESNTGADGDVSKLVDPVQPIRNYPSEFIIHKNIAPSSVSSSKNKVQRKKDNSSKNRENVRNNHKTRESDKVSDRESSVYYYDYYDYENSGNNFNRHESNDLRARQVGRKLLSLNSLEPDEDISTPGKKSNSNSNEKFYGDRRNKKLESRLHYSPMELSSPLSLESSVITEEPSKFIRCTFNKSIVRFLSDKNIRAEDMNQAVYPKNNAEMGFLKRNLKSISPAHESSLSEDDPLRRVFVSGDFEADNGELNEKQANVRYERGSKKEEDSIKDLYKLFGRDYELSVKGKLHLHFPKSPKNTEAEDSSRRKRCSGRKRPKGRRKRRRRKRKFTNEKQSSNCFSNGNDDSVVDVGDGKVEQPGETAPENSKTPLEKITNFFKKVFGDKARKRIKAKIIKIIPGKKTGEDSDTGESTTPTAQQKKEGSGCNCNECKATVMPEIAYTSIAVDTISTEGEETPGDLNRQLPDSKNDPGDNFEPRGKKHGITRGYQCHCRKVTNDGDTNLPNEQQYQTTISMDNSPESSSTNNDLDTHSKPDAEIEVSQLPDLQTQTNAVYTTTPIINTENPISSDNTMTTIDSNGNLGNDVVINGDDERMKDVLDILRFVQKVEKLMVNHKMPFRIGDERGGVEIKLQKIYIPGKKQSIQDLEDGSAGRISNDFSTEPIDTTAILQTVKDSPDSFPLKTKSEENSNPESPPIEIKGDQIPAGETPVNSQKNSDISFDRLKKHKEYENLDEFETYIEGPPADLLSNGKPERNEKSPAEKQRPDEQRIAPGDQSSSLGGEPRRKKHRWKKRRRRPKGRRNRTALGRRRLFSAQQRHRRNDFAFTSAEGGAAEGAERRQDKSPAYWHYTRCSNKKRKMPAAPAGPAT